jgi:hypothetical protein
MNTDWVELVVLIYGLTSRLCTRTCTYKVLLKAVYICVILVFSLFLIDYKVLGPSPVLLPNIIFFLHFVEYMIDLSAYLRVLSLMCTLLQKLFQAHFLSSLLHLWYTHEAIDGPINACLQLNLLNALKVLL